MRIFVLSRRLTAFCLAFAVCSLALQASGGSTDATGTWSESSLQLPRRYAPWKFMAEVDGNYLAFRVPGDISLLRQYPESTQARTWARIALRDRNLEILEGLAVGAEQILKREKFHRVPQQDRHMDEIVISFDPSDVVKEDPLYKHEPILRRLPDYTYIHIFVPEEFAGIVRERLRALRLPNRTGIYPVSVWEGERDGITVSHTCEAWTQDLFRVSLNASGRQYLFTPANYLQSTVLDVPDIDFLDRLVTGSRRRKIVRLPIFFHAGNILMGESTRRMLFIGKGLLKKNEQMYFNAIHAKPADAGVISLLQATSGVAEAHVLPNSTNLFHLDMVMAILDKSTIALVDPLDKERLAPADREVVDEIRKTLTALGFTIVPIPTVVKRIENFQSPVNIVPFLNRHDNKRYLYLPTYPDSLVTVQGKSTSLNGLIRDAYAARGFTVIPVEDRFSAKKGDLHCVLKVIN